MAARSLLDPLSPAAAIDATTIDPPPIDGPCIDVATIIAAAADDDRSTAGADTAGPIDAASAHERTGLRGAEGEETSEEGGYQNEAFHCHNP
jgi:hypothetical protein